MSFSPKRAQRRRTLYAGGLLVGSASLALAGEELLWVLPQWGLLLQPRQALTAEDVLRPGLEAGGLVQEPLGVLSEPEKAKPMPKGSREKLHVEFQAGL